MKTKCVWIEQKKADTFAIDKILNKEIKKLEKGGYRVKELRVAVGRDADSAAGLRKRFAITFVLMYE